MADNSRLRRLRDDALRRGDKKRADAIDRTIRRSTPTPRPTPTPRRRSSTPTPQPTLTPTPTPQPDINRLKRLRYEAAKRGDSSRAKAIEENINRENLREKKRRAENNPNMRDLIPGIERAIERSFNRQNPANNRDLAKEAIMVKKLGEPRTPEETALLAKATYTPDQLAGFSDEEKAALGLNDINVANQVFDPNDLKKLGFSENQITKLEPLGNLANQAFADKVAVGDPATALGILSNALNTKSNVTNQQIGGSSLFAQAGLPTEGAAGFAILDQSLNQRSQEMKNNFNSFRSRVGEGQNNLRDTLAKYQAIIDRYDKKQSELLRTNELAQAFENKIKLIEEQKKVNNNVLSSNNSEWTYDVSNGAYINKEGEVKYPDDSQSDATGNLVDVTKNSGVDKDIAANCVKYIRQKYAKNLPFGLWRTEDKRNAVDPAIKTPQVGDIIFTSESYPGTDTGHVARIIDIKNGKLVLEEANYRSGKVTTGRVLSLDDQKILGYYREGFSNGGFTASKDNPRLSIFNEGITPHGVETFNGKTISEIDNNFGDLKAQARTVVSSLSGTETERNKFRSEIASLIQKGKYSDANKYINSLVFSTKGFNKKAFNDWTLSGSQIEKAVSVIDELPNVSVNWWKNTIESNKPYADFKKDPEWVKVKAQIEAAQGTIRRAQIGSQVTAVELESFAGDLYINKNDDLQTVKNKLSILAGLTKNAQTTMIDITKGIYKTPKNENSPRKAINVELNPLNLNL